VKFRCVHIRNPVSSMSKSYTHMLKNQAVDGTDLHIGFPPRMDSGKGAVLLRPGLAELLLYFMS
jgi:hypothetical protein